MTEFDFFGNQRTGQLQHGLHLYLQLFHDWNSHVGDALEIRASDSGSYNVSLLGTLAGRYSLAVLLNTSAVEPGAAVGLREISVMPPLNMTVIAGVFSALGSEVTSADVEGKAPGWLGGDLTGFVDEVLGGFYSNVSAVNKFALLARDRSPFLPLLHSLSCSHVTGLLFYSFCILCPVESPKFDALFAGICNVLMP